MRRGSPRILARIDAAEAYDVVLSMSVVAAGGRTPLANAMRQAAPDLAVRVTRFAPSDWMWAHLVTVATDAPPPRDVAAFLAHLEHAPAREILRHLIGYYVRWFRRTTPPEVMDAAVAGRADAIRQVLRTSQPHDALWQAALRARLDAGAARTKADLIALVSAWDERVRGPVIASARRQLRAAVNERRRDLRRRGAVATISALVGWDYVPEPGITRVVIVPSLVLSAEHEFEVAQTKVICVPAAPPARPSVPPAVLSRLRVLADESRLRIVVALGRSELGAQELADATGLALTTVLHHLEGLANAGIVEGGGRRRPYRLRAAGLDTLAREIKALMPH